MPATRILAPEYPWPEPEPGSTPQCLQRGIWPAHWVSVADGDARPLLAAYRRAFSLDASAEITIHVSADERYELYLDGAMIGRGPQRGDRAHWHYESYRLALEAGEHVLVARVWSLGEAAPFPQRLVGHGFLLAAEGPHGELLHTGVAPWEAKRLGGYAVEGRSAMGTGARERWDAAAMDWGFERGASEGWAPVVVGPQGKSADRAALFQDGERMLRPATLRQMSRMYAGGRVRQVDDIPAARAEAVPFEAPAHLDGEAQSWQGLLHGCPMTVPANTSRRVLIDLEAYLCAYPWLRVRGGAGAEVRVAWAESLYETDDPTDNRKGNRDAIAGKFWRSRHFCADDVFLPDGGARELHTLWWRAGRYVLLTVTTADAPLTLEGLAFEETRYPLEQEGDLACDDTRVGEAWPLWVRVLQVNCHETYMDCPYYEQQQWVGDTRVQALIGYTLTRDAAPQRAAIALVGDAVLPGRLTPAFYPVRQHLEIPTFSLAWVGMVTDHALWRGDEDFVSARMPVARMVLDNILAHRDEDGLVRMPPGWSYTDWSPGWSWGIPPGADTGPTATFNWWVVAALSDLSLVETWLGEFELADRAWRLATEQAGVCAGAFWDPKRGRFAEDTWHTYASEHAQAMAVAGGMLKPEMAERVAVSLREDTDLARTSLYFSHYLFDAYAQLGLDDLLFERLDTWFGMPVLGLRTTLETADPSRSDAHGWSAHPLYHMYATVLGIRPSAMAFAAVEIAPQLGPLRWARGTMPHPAGAITVAVERTAGGLSGTVSLPEGVAAVVRHGEQAQAIDAGAQGAGFAV